MHTPCAVGSVSALDWYMRAMTCHICWNLADMVQIIIQTSILQKQLKVHTMSNAHIYFSKLNTHHYVYYC